MFRKGSLLGPRDFVHLDDRIVCGSQETCAINYTDSRKAQDTVNMHAKQHTELIKRMTAATSGYSCS